MFYQLLQKQTAFWAYLNALLADALKLSNGEHIYAWNPHQQYLSDKLDEFNVMPLGGFLARTLLMTKDCRVQSILIHATDSVCFGL